jgi:hypothetical protein
LFVPTLFSNKCTVDVEYRTFSSMEYQSTKSIYNNVTKDEFVSTSEISDEEAEPKAIDFVKDTLTRKGIRLLQEIGSG